MKGNGDELSWARVRMVLHGKHEPVRTILITHSRIPSFEGEEHFTKLMYTGRGNSLYLHRKMMLAHPILVSMNRDGTEPEDPVYRKGCLGLHQEILLWGYERFQGLSLSCCSA